MSRQICQKKNVTLPNLSQNDILKLHS